MTTRLTVTCTGTHPPSQPGIRSTPQVAPSANSVCIAAILASSLGCSFGLSAAIRRQS